MSKQFQLDENLFYPLMLEREREAHNFLPDILREMDFKPRRMVVEQKKVTLPFGVSFSKTRIVIDE